MPASPVNKKPELNQAGQFFKPGPLTELFFITGFVREVLVFLGVTGTGVDSFSFDFKTHLSSSFLIASALSTGSIDPGIINRFSER